LAIEVYIGIIMFYFTPTQSYVSMIS